jgi:hypothetical protein
MTIFARYRRLPFHRSVRHTVLYWVLGLWAVELTVWICVVTVVGCVLALRYVMPHVLKFVAMILAFVAFLVAAFFSLLHGRKVNRRTAGCCTSCGGTGSCYDESTGGRCWDCRGTGHLHEGACSRTWHDQTGRLASYPRIRRLRDHQRRLLAQPQDR